MAARDQQAVVPIARRLSTLGFQLIGTSGTVSALVPHGIAITTIRKIREGRPNLLDYLANGTIDLIVNTPSGKGARTDEGRIRASAVSHGIPCITTIAGARAAVSALERLREGKLNVYALQDLLQTRPELPEPLYQNAPDKPHRASGRLKAVSWWIVTVTMLPQHLTAEELVKLLAIMDAQRTLGVDLVDDTLDNPRT